MTLHEALKQLPQDITLRNHVDNKVATAAEWLQRLRDEGGVEISRSRHNYGREERVGIYCPGIGTILSQV